MTRSPITAQPLTNGRKMPAFELIGTDKNTYHSNQLYKKNGFVMAFIHATWCPYCIRLLVGLNRISQKLAGLQVGVACVSADDVDVLYGYQVSIQPPLQYVLLADSQPSIAHQFGIYDEEHEAPYPAVFYANGEHLIQYTDVSNDPDCYPNLERLLDVIQYGAKALPQ